MRKGVPISWIIYGTKVDLTIPSRKYHELWKYYVGVESKTPVDSEFNVYTKTVFVPYVKVGVSLYIFVNTVETFRTAFNKTKHS